MSSKVIKFVAGGGKTTYSKRLMKKVPGGLYLAFTNSVVNDMKNSGILARTIDSLFHGYILPKFFELIPLLNRNAAIQLNDSGDNYIGLMCANLRFDIDGNIFNKSKKIDKVNLFTLNKDLHKMGDFPNSMALKIVFSNNKLFITHEQRANICAFVIREFSNELIEFIDNRFSYIVFDEAQDLKAYHEEFSKVIFYSSIRSRFLGDDYQNINNGGKWFESLSPNKQMKRTHRCPDTNCLWIRENLDIEIYGNSDDATFSKVRFEDVSTLDNGNRMLLYNAKAGRIKGIVEQWNGPHGTIKSVKGSTIFCDVIIVGVSMNRKNLYTAITRTKVNVYTTVTKIID